MGSINSRSGKLIFDFRYNNHRCRETSKFADTPANRIKAEKVMKRIEAEILLGQFDYLSYFPKSKMAQKLAKIEQQIQRHQGKALPTFNEYSQRWYQLMELSWRDRHKVKVAAIIKQHLMPYFGGKEISSITKTDILNFRSIIAKQPGRKSEFLSAATINKIMQILRAILNEAADEYEFKTSFRGINPLQADKSDVKPLSLEQIYEFLEFVRNDYRDYFIVRFFTGMRSGEVHGLRWKNVDLKRKVIIVDEAWNGKKLDKPKNQYAFRAIALNQMAIDALASQKLKTHNKSEFVFCNTDGNPLISNNVHRRIWVPTLKCLKMEPRRLYQTRHTAATLWLAAGESPEWIARQLGHSTTEMLFRVYSRYVPNLGRPDGQATEQLLQQEWNHDA